MLVLTSSIKHPIFSVLALLFFEIYFFEKYFFKIFDGSKLYLKNSSKSTSKKIYLELEKSYDAKNWMDCSSDEYYNTLQLQRRSSSQLRDIFFWSWYFVIFLGFLTGKNLEKINFKKIYLETEKSYTAINWLFCTTLEY